MKRAIFYFVLSFSLNMAVCFAEEPIISSIEPEFGYRGDEIRIYGSGFHITDKDAEEVDQTHTYVSFFYRYSNQEEKIVEWRAGVRKWEHNLIIATVPLNAKIGKVSIQVFNGRKSTKAPKEFWVTSTGLVDSAIRLKKRGMSDTKIVDHLFHEGTHRLKIEPEAKKIFGNTVLTAGEIDELKESGFQDDFIAKFEGHPQYVSLGVAPLWLIKTADLVYAPIVRVFLQPRSYFYKYEPYFSWPRFGLWQIERWDLNFGYTTRTSTTESNDIEEKKSYALIGFSNQLNRSALINIGFALVPGDIEGVESQFYIGFTVDYNLLKGIGLVSK